MTDADILTHYAPHGDVTASARALAAAKGYAGPPIPPHVFAALDEMHVGGVRAAQYLFEAMKPRPGMSVLDIGSGLGGPARVMAAEYGCHVAGIDLSPPFCAAAEDISIMSGLDKLTRFEEASALALPFPAQGFDMAYTIHTAMNIADKDRLYTEAARVLKPGAPFGVYDVMAGPGAGAMQFPVPWAAHPGISHLQTPAEAAARLQKAGFDVCAQEDRTETGRAALAALLASGKMADDAMGGDRALRIQNFVKNIDEGCCAVWQIIARRV